MIPDGGGQHYIAVEKLPPKLRRITSKHHGNFHCVNCLHSFAIGNKLEPLKDVRENKDFCNIVLPSERH